MEARFIIRTHREVSRPGIFTALIRQCTSATQSTSVSLVASRLAKLFEDSSHRLSHHKHHRPGGADFAVDMAQKFDFLTANCFWNWKGWVINALARQEPPTMPDEYLTLTPYERVMYLRYYLESQGALILEFAKLFLEHESLSYKELSHDRYVEDIFLAIWQGYLPLAQQLRYRVELKDKIAKMKRRRSYKPDTRPHKFRPIIEPLRDFRFLIETDDNVYSPVQLEAKVPLQVLVDELQDFEQVEIRFKRFDYYAIIAKCLEPVAGEQTTTDDEQLEAYIGDAYNHVKQGGTGLASINAIVDVVSVRLLCDFGQVVSRQRIIDVLETRRAENPYQVRFHVNRRGERAYVVIAPEAFTQSTTASR